LATLVMAWRAGASRAVLRRGSVVVGVAVAQSILGYTQYFTGVPAILVGFHILGATSLWIATLRWHLGLTEISPATQEEPSFPAGDDSTASPPPPAPAETGRRSGGVASGPSR